MAWKGSTIVKEFKRECVTFNGLDGKPLFAQKTKQIRTEIDSFEQNTQQCWSAYLHTVRISLTLDALHYLEEQD
jgi:hypothetical protein